MSVITITVINQHCHYHHDAGAGVKFTFGVRCAQVLGPCLPALWFYLGIRCGTHLADRHCRDHWTTPSSAALG